MSKFTDNQALEVCANFAKNGKIIAPFDKRNINAIMADVEKKAIKGRPRATVGFVTDKSKALAAKHKKAGVRVLKVAVFNTGLSCALKEGTNVYDNARERVDGHSDYVKTQGWYDHDNSLYGIVSKRSDTSKKYLETIPSQDSYYYSEYFLDTGNGFAKVEKEALEEVMTPSGYKGLTRESSRYSATNQCEVSTKADPVAYSLEGMFYLSYNGEYYGQFVA
jgi:hypothetical protein